MISEFNRFFKKQSLASTYKPTFLKCLLDLGDFEHDEGGKWVEKKGDELVVDLQFVAARFLRYYHPLKFKFKLKQEATSKRIAIYGILKDNAKEMGVKSTPSKKFLCSDKFSEMLKTTVSNNAIRQQVLPKLLNDCNIYTINKGLKKIIIKKEIVDFMKDNKKILEAALNHMISKYLENCNASPNISTKLEEKISRKSLSTKEFGKIISLRESRCFYCNCKFDSFEQEHFLPWNFLFQTENFNIVPACETCNGSKKDKLPHRRYLKLIVERNEKLDNISMGYSKEFLEKLYETCRIEYHGRDKKLWEPNTQICE